MTLDEIRECLAARTAWQTLEDAADSVTPDADDERAWTERDRRFDAAVVAYCEERARQIAQVLVAEEHARAEAVRELLSEAERFCVDGGRWADCAHPYHGDLEAAIARVRVLFPEAK